MVESEKWSHTNIHKAGPGLLITFTGPSMPSPAPRNYVDIHSLFLPVPLSVSINMCVCKSNRGTERAGPYSGVALFCFRCAGEVTGLQTRPSEDDGGIVFVCLVLWKDCTIRFQPTSYQIAFPRPEAGCANKFASVQFPISLGWGQVEVNI